MHLINWKYQIWYRGVPKILLLFLLNLLSIFLLLLLSLCITIIIFGWTTFFINVFSAEAEFKQNNNYNHNSWNNVRKPLYDRNFLDYYYFTRQRGAAKAQVHINEILIPSSLWGSLIDGRFSEGEATILSASVCSFDLSIGRGVSFLLAELLWDWFSAA